jgi:hypothetical protein
MFTLMAILPGIETQYSVIRFLVHDSGEVTVLQNRAARVRELIMAAYGIDLYSYKMPVIAHVDALTAFKEALEACENKPNWFRGVEFVEGSNEDSEFDLHVQVDMLNRKRQTSIPVKLKSSIRTKADYFRRLSPSQVATRIVIVWAPRTAKQSMQELWHLIREARMRPSFR